MPTYRLHYFDARGRVEPVRLMFHSAGVKFDDVRYAGDKWAAFKPKTPFGQMPCLEIDGVLFGQSGAIMNYLARELGMYGKGNMEALQVDVIVGIVGDLLQLLVKAMFLEKDETKKKELTAQIGSEDGPKALGHFVKLLGQNRFFVGNSLTLADLIVYDTVDNLLNINSDILTNFPQISANRKLVEANAGIAAYLKIRK